MEINLLLIYEVMINLLILMGLYMEMNVLLLLCIELILDYCIMLML